MNTSRLPDLRISAVGAAVVRPLRRGVLRRGLPARAARFEGDANSSTRHLAATVGSRVVGVLSAMDASCPDDAARTRQLRGMAVDEDARGRGVGRRMLASLIAGESAHGFWCNARTSAQRFYEACGWHVISRVFEIKDAGPHVCMVFRDPAYGPDFDSRALPLPDLGLRCPGPGCGHPLAGLARPGCRECGLTIDLEQFLPPGDQPRLYIEGRTVRATPDVAAVLNHHHIAWQRDVGTLETVMQIGGQLPSSAHQEVCVARHDYLAAIDLLRRASRGSPPPPPPDIYPGDDWVCPCGEENPAGFELCWACEQPLGESADQA